MLSILTTILGCVALVLSLSLCVYFLRARYAIGRAVAYMLAGESVGLSVTIIFSLFSNGIFDIMGPVTSMIARVLVFATAVTTSTHLAYHTSKIQSGEDDAE